MAVVEPLRPAPDTLEDVRDRDKPDPYPNDLLQAGDTALVMFCAYWYGRQDAYWIAQADMKATCVDTDKWRLDGMAGIYPDGWEWVAEDAFAFAEHAAVEGYQWDIVSLDPYTNKFDQCAEQLGLWCLLARKAVIIGTGADSAVTAPVGWRITRLQHRSDYRGGVYWTVLEPA